MTMGDRVAVMRAGVLQQCDIPQVLYSNPTNLFVAAFIGSPAMNLFEAVVSDDGEGLLLGSQTLALGSDIHQQRTELQKYRGRKIAVGLRAEDLPIVSEDTRAATSLTGNIEAIEALGSELLVHFSIDATRLSGETTGRTADEELLATAIDIVGEGVARVEPRAAVRVGDVATFAVYPERLHFFDLDTQNVIH
jgi:multiple sugar transport system ATP-binding protein